MCHLSVGVVAPVAAAAAESAAADEMEDTSYCSHRGIAFVGLGYEFVPRGLIRLIMGGVTIADGMFQADQGTPHGFVGWLLLSAHPGEGQKTRTAEMCGATSVSGMLHDDRNCCSACMPPYGGTMGVLLCRRWPSVVLPGTFDDVIRVCIHACGLFQCRYRLHMHVLVHSAASS
jgi:hypothetical protein